MQVPTNNKNEIPANNKNEILANNKNEIRQNTTKGTPFSNILKRLQQIQEIYPNDFRH